LSDDDDFPLISVTLNVLEYIEEMFSTFGVVINDIIHFKFKAKREQV
jgi:hypothetical protein